MEWQRDPSAPPADTRGPAFPRNFPTNVWAAAQRWRLLELQEIQTLLALAPDDVRACLGFIASCGYLLRRWLPLRVAACYRTSA